MIILLLTVYKRLHESENCLLPAGTMFLTICTFFILFYEFLKHINYLPDEA